MQLSDINECSTRPCQNGGRCEDQVDGFQCRCANGYEGNVCQFSELLYMELQGIPQRSAPMYGNVEISFPGYIVLLEGNLCNFEEQIHDFDRYQ